MTVTYREALWGQLGEAAEIEHNLMCCYLYAYFSLKTVDDPELTADERDAVERWRRVIMSVAVEEMAHLATVSNILSALGAPAHFLRQNFPVPAGYHPAGIVVKLAPFSMETLDHFIYLERPENADLIDGSGFRPERPYRRNMNTDRATPVARDYDTVGQLYATILNGLEGLSQTLGEGVLFIGKTEHQVGPDVASLPSVTVVQCLKSAREAISAIVIQGEGSTDDTEGSHYQRFLAIKQEYAELLAIRPEFVPAYRCAHNPVMREPPTPDGKVWVNAEPAASLLDLANAYYNHSLRCLAVAYSGVASETQSVLVASSIEIMHALTPLARSLARLPANAAAPHCTAGISFATLRSLAALPPTPAAPLVLAERCDELAMRSDAFANGIGRDTEVGGAGARTLRNVARRLRASAANQAVESQDALRVGTPAPGTTASNPPTPIELGAGVEAIPGTSLDLVFDARRCIHARHCVLGQPDVFKANVEGPWIDPDAASTEALVTVAHMCASGAIGYHRKDGGQDETPPPVNLVQIRENGPLGVRADIRLEGEAIGCRATLCRCGASKNKPYCDSSHIEIGFCATGEPETRPSASLASRNGALTIDLETNGPLMVTGNLEICAGTGRTVDRLTRVRLCRCGGSSSKPYCDNTHRLNGFMS